MSEICPIWHEECPRICLSHKNVIPIKSPHQSAEFPVINCGRTGIFSYRPDAELQDIAANLDEDAMLCLRAEIAYQNVVYKTIPILDDALIRKIKSKSIPLMPMRLDLALEWLVRHSHRIGSMPLQDTKKISSFLAFCYCHDEWRPSQIGREASMIFDALKNEALVAIPVRPLDGVGPQGIVRLKEPVYDAVNVTHKGYARYEELQRKSVDSSLAFVAMWFHSSMDAVYNEAIAPAIRDAGYEPVRVDNVQHNRKIDDEIIALIRRSRFVVADFTAENPKEPRGGVYYEAGFAYGLGREVIYTCRKDFVEALHFDTRQYNHIVWEEEKLSDFRKALQNRIEATIGRGPKTKDDAE